jgi:hypothetical protein
LKKVFVVYVFRVRPKKKSGKHIEIEDGAAMEETRTIPSMRRENVAKQRRKTTK